MAAPNTVFIPLQSNASGDAEALGLKVWAGETAGAFMQASVTEGRFNFKTASGGATETQWIVSGRRGSEYHTRGEDILIDQSADSRDYVKTLKTAEVVVRTDRPLIAPSFLDRQDSILTHFDSQAEMRRQAGQTLARTIDKNRLICVARGAHRHEANGTDANDGVFVEGVKAGSDAVTALSSVTFAGGSGETADGTEEFISRMAERFDNLEVPMEGRMMFVGPSVYHYLVNNLDDYINVDLRGEGSKARATIFHASGFEIIKTTNMPTGTIANPAGLGSGSSTNKYAIKATGLAALFATRDALAETRLSGGFSIDANYIPERRGMLVDMAWSGGIKELRPECCGAIYNAAIPANPND